MTSAHPNRPLAGLAVAALGGLCLAVQARINSELSGAMHDGVAAATLSFGGGFVVLALIVPALPAGRRGIARLVDALRTGGIAWWQCLGGVLGAWLVTSQGLTAGILGVAVFTVAIVAGQVLSSLVVDRVGLGPAGPQRVTTSRLVGAGIAVVAVVIAVSEDFGNPSALGLAVLPALAGAGTAVQQAVTGQVRRAADSPSVATLANFLVGTVALVVAVLIETGIRGWPTAVSDHWWAYCGGLLGIVLIMAAAIAVPMVGVLLVGLATVAGQLVGSIGVDAIAPTPGQHLAVTSVIGAVLTLGAVLVAALPGMRRRNVGRPDKAESAS